jgi:hypothetical protein
VFEYTYFSKIEKGSDTVPSVPPLGLSMSWILINNYYINKIWDLLWIARSEGTRKEVKIGRILRPTKPIGSKSIYNKYKNSNELYKNSIKM